MAAADASGPMSSVYLTCDECGGRYRNDFVGVSDETTTAVLAFASFSGWRCSLCRNRTRAELVRLRSTESLLSGHVTRLEAEVARLRGDLSLCREIALFPFVDEVVIAGSATVNVCDADDVSYYPAMSRYGRIKVTLLFHAFLL